MLLESVSICLAYLLRFATTGPDNGPYIPVSNTSPYLRGWQWIPRVYIWGLNLSNGLYPFPQLRRTPRSSADWSGPPPPRIARRPMPWTSRVSCPGACRLVGFERGHSQALEVNSMSQLEKLELGAQLDMSGPRNSSRLPVLCGTDQGTC